MCSKNILLVLGSLVLLAVAAHSMDSNILRETIADRDTVVVLSRKVRSPDGSIDLTYKNDRGGREASVQYNQNLYKSGDGRVNVDAYAHGTRNFDYNRNDYGGGIRGSIRF